MWDVFAEVAARQPDSVAVVDGDRSVSFRELSDLAVAFSRRIPAGTRFVGVVVDHGLAQIACLLGALRAGAAYVPAEPDFPPERVRFMMGEPPVELVFTQRDLAERFDGFELRFVEDVVAETAGRAPLSPVPSATPVAPDDLAYVLYTSGSTGAPKGVCVTNANVCSYARAFGARFRPRPGDVMLQQSVCSFDIFVEEVFGSLLNGAALAIPLGDDRETPEALLDYAGRAGATMVSGFPYLLADWNRLGPLPPSIRLLISGGDVLRASYVDRLLPQTTVYNTYGPSETTVCATYFEVNGTEPLPDGSYPIGTPILGAGVMLVDEAGDPLNEGGVGEICIVGKGVAAGYVDSALNVHRDGSGFGTFPTGERYFRSGDLGEFLPDGNLAFFGRRDAQVMIGGKRVEPGEVESVLCLSPEVAAALVVSREDEDGLPYLTAYLVPDPSVEDGNAFPLRRVLERARRQLTPFMIPEFFALVDEIPLNANGKPDASELPAVLKPTADALAPSPKPKGNAR